MRISYLRIILICTARLDTISILSIPIRPILVVPLRGAVMRKGGVTIVSVSRITILVSVI